MNHLLRRGSRYYIRRKVPLDLQPILGRKEIVRALGTADPREAAMRCRAASVLVDQEFIAAREAQHATSGSTLSKSTPPQSRDWAPFASRGHEEVHDELNAIESSDDRDDQAEQYEDAVSRTMLVIAEARRRLGIEDAEPRATALAKRGGATQKPLPLADAVSLWENERKPSQRSARAHELTAEVFERLTGISDAARIQRSDVIRFRQLALDEGQSQTNVRKHLAALRTVLGLCHALDRLPENAAAGVSQDVQKAPGDRRQPFAADHIRLIFGQPLDTRPERHWIPRLLLWTGARITEIAQLRPGDVHEVEYTDEEGRPSKHWVIEIRDEADGQSVKTAGSRRRVPLHAELIDAGFLTYRLARAKDEWLFDLRTDTYGSRGVRISEALNAWLRQIGIKDRRYVVHSFRHHFANACRDSGIAENETAALMGHTDGSVHRRYGSMPLGPLVRAMLRLRIHGWVAT